MISRLTRRNVTKSGLGALLMAFAGRALGEAAIPGRFGPARRFSWDDLVAQAQMRARRPYARQIAAHAVPEFDTHVRLSYDPAEMVAGRLRLFPAKVDTAPDAVNIHVVENGMARAILDTHGLFGGGQSADVAGFRVMEAHGGGDWLASLGASYFRAVGPTGQYGLSARAIAVNTAMPGPEEFPAFTDFWIEQKGADHLLIHALVDGPSLCGAYAFDITRTAAGWSMGCVRRCLSGATLRGWAWRPSPACSISTSPPAPPMATGGLRCMTATALPSTPARASGSGARWTIRRGRASICCAPMG